MPLHRPEYTILCSNNKMCNTGFTIGWVHTINAAGLRNEKRERENCSSPPADTKRFKQVSQCKICSQMINKVSSIRQRRQTLSSFSVKY